MKLVILLVCLLLWRFSSLGEQLHRFTWFANYQNAINKLFHSQPEYLLGWLGVCIYISPILILTTLCYWLSYDWLYGLSGLVISVLIVFYCLEPAKGSSNNKAQGNQATFLEQMNEGIIAIMVYFILLGPIACLFYRLVCLLHHQTQKADETRNDSSGVVEQMMAWLNFLPVRCLIILFALVGHFSKVIAAIRAHFLSAPGHESTLLVTAAQAAIDIDSQGDSTNLSQLQSLIESSVVLALVLLAIFTLGAFVA